MKKENPLIKCACGCSQLRPQFDKRGRERRYINEHFSRAWSGSEIEFLRKYYPHFPSKMSAFILNRNYPAVKTKASKLGLKRIRGRDLSVLIQCGCGCGQERPKYDRWGKTYKYIKWHERRGKVGTNKGKTFTQEHRDRMSKSAKRGNKNHNYKHGLTGTREYSNYIGRKYNERKKLLREKELWTLDMELACKKFFICCIVCGTTENLVIDHVYALYNGFPLEPGNAVRLCRSHNNWKWRHWLHELGQKYIILFERAANSFAIHWDEINRNFYDDWVKVI